MANEKRLIDANALKNSLKKWLSDADVLCSQEVYNTIEDCVYEVGTMPTVDAVEVVHGEWGEIYTCHGERLWGYKCSQCEQDSANKSNYCPNCGAKMDGGNEDG